MDDFDVDAHAVQLLRPLAGEPGAASRVDPYAALSEGRRRRRARRIAGVVTVGALTAAALAVGPAALGDPHARRANLPAVLPSAAVSPAPSPSVRPTASPVSGCTVRELPTGRHREAIVTGGDPTGRWLLGRSYPKDGSDRPMLVWRDGSLFSQNPLPGDDAALRDVTSTGLAVGYTYEPMRAYLVRDGTATVLPDGDGAQATAVNEAGMIAGHREQGGKLRPVRWPAADQRPVDLPMPPGADEATVLALFEDGTVVAKVTGKDQNTYGWLWLPDGGQRRLAGSDGKAGSEIQVRAGREGWIFGRNGDSGWRYDVQADRYDPLPEGLIYGDAVAATGWAVIGGLDNGSHLWQGPGTTTITLPVPAGWRTKPAPMTSVSVLSDDGRTIGGHGSAFDGPNTALVWTCT